MKKTINLSIADKRSYVQFIRAQERMLSEVAASSFDAEYAWVKDGEEKKIDLESMTVSKVSFRSPFHIDTDLITYSKYAMKLHGKTQVFIAPNDTQLVTRASHTDIVTTLATGIARSLSLNEDLTRAIAKGHDIGHTAFGHEGEDELERICQEQFCFSAIDEFRKKRPVEFEKTRKKFGVNSDIDLSKVPILHKTKDEKFDAILRREFYVQDFDKKIFSHAKQSFRFLCLFEAKKLTAQTIYGIISHNYIDQDTYRNIRIEFDEKVRRLPDPNPLRHQLPTDERKERYAIGKEHLTYEAEVMKFSDFLAFSIHDLDDALRAGNINVSFLQKEFKKRFPKEDFDKFLKGNNRYTMHINNFIERNKERMKNGESLTIPDYTLEFLQWLFIDVTQKHIFTNPEIMRKSEEGRRFIRGLYDVWSNDQNSIRKEFPEIGPEIGTRFKGGYNETRKFCDLISTMTDKEIITVYRHYFGPEQ